MKVCNKCNQEKPIVEFHKHKLRKDGHANSCKSCVSLRQKENYDKIKEKHDEWAANNPELHKEYQREYLKEYMKTEKGKIKHRAANKKYFKSPKGKAAAALKKHKRREKEKKLINFWDYDIEQNMLKEQNYQCKICKTPIATNYHRDHIVPVTKQIDGGLGLHPDNVQLLCSSCNHIKGSND